MNAATRTILVIEDETAIRDMIRFALQPTGFHIMEAGDATEAEHRLAERIPDIILQDWMLPGMSGIDFVSQLRKRPLTRHIPIIMLTARAEENNRVRGLEAGADDYITKPFSPRELIARIHSILRRGPLATPDGVLRIHPLALNPQTHTVTLADTPLTLTPIEYKLLHFFMKNKGRVFSRAYLLDHVWGSGHFIDERTVDVHIKRLRARLKTAELDKLIQTVRGSGYRWMSDAT